MDQEPQDNHSGAGEIDLNKILLPKKETHSVDSAQRTDASVLMAQEQNAELPKPVREPLPVSPSQKPPESARPLQTLAGDIESVVQGKGVSVVSIAAAEANRRGTQSLSADAQLAPASPSHPWRTLAAVGAGVVLLAVAAGLIIYSLTNKAPVATQTAGQAPFISVDNAIPVTVPNETTGSAVIQQLASAKNSLSLSLGLVAQLYVQQAGTSSNAQPRYVDTQGLLGLVAPELSQTFVRNVAPVYLLGVHSFGVLQPFLILKVDSYSLAYAGMLAWEPSMKQDLSPLFDYTPPVKPSLNAAASSTEASTTEPLPAQTGFIDAIVDNHDARVLEDPYGTVHFLWTFLDRQTIVITTNGDTLREIIRRLIQAPVTSVPGGR